MDNFSNSFISFWGNESWQFTGAPVKAPPPPQQFWSLISTTTTARAYPETAGNEYGSTAFTNCTPSTPCAQDLEIDFDTMNGSQVHLGGTGDNDLLTATNSVDSFGSGIQALAMSPSNVNSATSLTITNDNGVAYTFSGGPVNYTGNDGLTYVLTSHPNPSGTYTGSFGTAAGSTITMVVNQDFSVSATATLAPQSLCPAQTSTLTVKTSDPVAIKNSIDG